MNSLYHEHMDLYDHARDLTCNTWSEKWLRRLNSFHVQARLAHNLCICGVHVKKSTIQHPAAGKGCYANQVFSEHELIGYYYVTLVYRNSLDLLHSRGIYGGGTMSVTEL